MTHMTYKYVNYLINDTATTEIYNLSLHDALPISRHGVDVGEVPPLPLQLFKILASSSRHFPGKKMKEACTLVYNTAKFTFNDETYQTTVNAAEFVMKTIKGSEFGRVTNFFRFFNV